jgi:hypothetical protein
MRHFMRLALAMQAEINQATTTLSLDALEMKIQKLMTAANMIQDDGEKAADAMRSGALGNCCAASLVFTGLAASTRASGGAGTAKVDSEVATARAVKLEGQAAAGRCDQNEANFATITARQHTQIAQGLQNRAAYSKALGDSSGQLSTSIGQVDAAQKNEEASSRRRDQKIAEAESARADAQQSGANHFIQQNLQSASAQLQLYRELLQEKNQMEKTANRVV